MRKNTVATTNPTTTQQKHCECPFQTRLLESLSLGLGLKNFSLRNSWIKDQICLSFLFLKFQPVVFSASLMVVQPPVGRAWDYQACHPGDIRPGGPTSMKVYTIQHCGFEEWCANSNKKEFTQNWILNL